MNSERLAALGGRALRRARINSETVLELIAAYRERLAECERYREALNAILAATPSDGESRAHAPVLFAQRNEVRRLAIEALGELSKDEEGRWFPRSTNP